MSVVARRLVAPAPGWTATADVVVVGSGIAGLTVALEASTHSQVLLVTKTVLDAGSTRWAQGGIAAAMDPQDSPAEHLADTLEAGAGLCDRAAVERLVTEGPERVRALIALGTRFDTDSVGALALTREGGHHRNRIAHSGGDATGAEIERALIAAVRATPSIEIIEHALVLDLLTGPDGQACGVTLHVIGEGQRDGVGAALGRVVVLATGGLGQVYASTTNPEVSTGDGVALALRAGAEVTDLEFVQFHPTVLWLGPSALGQQPLVSEAVRGEGAVLIDGDGERFMTGQHPLADLAPRDIVAKAIFRQMRIKGTDHVYLDARHLGRELIERRFPTIVAACRAHGIDPAAEPIPVAPAAHYASGGVRTDLVGRTSVPGLYACGEVSCTGVHGANRLASNSLLEGLVFASAIARDLAAGLPDRVEPVVAQGPAGQQLQAAATASAARAGIDPASRVELQQAMSEGVGVLRGEASLAQAAKRLDAVAAGADVAPDLASWEMTNLHTVATALTHAAAVRMESRGCHWREDFPESSPQWLGHVVVQLDDTGAVRATFEEML